MDYINRLLNRSPTEQSKLPLAAHETGIDPPLSQGLEHEVKVQLSDTVSVSSSAPESLSIGSSFHSLSSSPTSQVCLYSPTESKGFGPREIEELIKKSATLCNTINESSAFQCNSIQNNPNSLFTRSSSLDVAIAESKSELNENDETSELQDSTNTLVAEANTILHKFDNVIGDSTLTELVAQQTEQICNSPESTDIHTAELEGKKIYKDTYAVLQSTEQDFNEALIRKSNSSEIDIDVKEHSSLDTPVTREEQYVDSKPLDQSSGLDTLIGNFGDLKLSEVDEDILFQSSEFLNSSEVFTTAAPEDFADSTALQFLLERGNSNKDSFHSETIPLYVKLDSLVSSANMLSQANDQPINEEQNGKNEAPVPKEDTPKRNSAIAAIDRLLFYSPITTDIKQKLEETQEKNEPPPSESKPQNQSNSDVNLAKELELVRSAVLQFEEELEKQKQDHEKEIAALQEKINKLQTQLSQEVQNKSQMTVVMEEYEKSISRLVRERESDRACAEREKAKLQEELQAAHHHLSNTEAAFNDVHLKYERLKSKTSAYVKNEALFKESIQENEETIKTLENRYEQLKNHAMAQLEKANLELDGIRKQHEAETVKLHAMVRKAELKSNSLAELVEQKTKENKELAQILDELIARVGGQNAE